ncbi:MAG: homoserine dehydrogenase [Candidatus Rokuibacteriota bacterium]|nr:MAG: homoserine dehydrogenase [Candidatus Rokubacteria bacterium]
MKEVRIGLLGLGTVGGGVIKILESRRAMLEERAVELVGGLEPARSFILKALATSKHVVTANKALLAHHGAELYDEARRRSATLAFEAAVAGGIPLIQAVKEGLVANRILSVFGIVNGTSNYILSKMTDEALDFSLVLKEAQAHGYAEADPTFDIEGNDSAHKLQILVTLAFRTFVDLEHIHTEGITGVTAQDIGYASELGYRIKLLAIAKAAPNGVEARVHPTMIAASSPLAAVSGVFNAVFITGDAVGDLMFYGRGAGQLPTASAVWSDVLEIARRVAHDIPATGLELPSAAAHPLTVQPMDDVRTSYYLRVMAQDRPGVLSRITGVLGENDISIASMIQKGRGGHDAVPVVMMTHEARERDMRRALAAIDRLAVPPPRKDCAGGARARTSAEASSHPDRCCHQPGAGRVAVSERRSRAARRADSPD